MKTLYVAIECLDDVTVADVDRLLTEEGNRYFPTYRGATEATPAAAHPQDCVCAECDPPDAELAVLESARVIPPAITLTLAGLPRHCNGCGSTGYRLSTFADSLGVACATCHRRIGAVRITAGG